MTDPEAAARYRSNLQGEVDSAAIYGALADSESDPKLAAVFRRLAETEQAHAAFWRRHLKGRADRLPRPSPRARLLTWLGRRFGPAFVLPAIAEAEVRDSGSYDGQPEARAAGLPAVERSHRRLLQAAAGPVDGLAGPTIALLEGRHRGAGGNALRAAVLGANDGLVSNLSLVMGVAGAEASSQTILVTGLAGLVAGACSMALGEWLSVTSARELYGRQIAAEAEELKTLPEEEREELVLIYQAKGLGEEQARALADRLLSRPETALDTLVREELGLDKDSLGGSAWAAAGTSFLLFSAGAICPVLPFFFLDGWTAILASLAAGGLALALVGAGTALFTGRGLAFSALRQLVIGYLAAAVTYGIGALVGVSLG